MSHASGAVRFEDGTVMFYEYNGTSDVAISHLYDTMQGVHDNWRKGEWLYCKCEGGEPVEIYSSYGSGFSFPGTACKPCKSLTHDMDFEMTHHRGKPTQKSWGAGHPDWWDEIDPEKLKIVE